MYSLCGTTLDLHYNTRILAGDHTLINSKSKLTARSYGSLEAEGGGDDNVIDANECSNPASIVADLMPISEDDKKTKFGVSRVSRHRWCKFHQ